MQNSAANVKTGKW